MKQSIAGPELKEEPKNNGNWRHNDRGENDAEKEHLTAENRNEDEADDTTEEIQEEMTAEMQMMVAMGLPVSFGAGRKKVKEFKQPHTLNLIPTKSISKYRIRRNKRLPHNKHTLPFLGHFWT